MPILKNRHREVRADGKPVFIVRTPEKSFLGERLHVPFSRGEARTVYPKRAFRFAEEFGYDVLLPEGHPGFEFAHSPDFERGSEDGQEQTPDYSLEEEDEEEDE